MCREPVSVGSLNEPKREAYLAAQQSRRCLCDESLVRSMTILALIGPVFRSHP